MRNKQILSLILATLLVVSLVPSFIFAEDTVEDTEEISLTESETSAAELENETFEMDEAEPIDETSEMESVVSENETSEDTDVKPIENAVQNVYNQAEEIVEAVSENINVFENAEGTEAETSDGEEHVHSFDEGVITKEADCGNAGTKTYTCECGYTYDEEIPATGVHTEGEETVVESREATTDVTGYQKWETHCTVCNALINSGTSWEARKGFDGVSKNNETCSKNGHTYGTLEVLVAPTTTKIGYGMRYCIVCNAAKACVIAKEEECTHEWDEGTVTKESSCVSAGTKKFTCKLCGATKEEEIPVSGHMFSKPEVLVEQSCEGEGATQQYCIVCGYKKATLLPKLGHKFSDPSYVWSEDNTTCTASAKCSNCGDECTETVTATKDTKDSTCTEDGYEKYQAVFTNSCFETQTKENTITKTGHMYLKPEVIKESTCELQGATQQFCMVCGAKKCSLTVAKGHDYSSPSYVWSEDNATCTATMNCSRCDKTVEETKDSTYTETPSTCIAAGKRVYSVIFENNNFLEQTKEVVLEKTAHSWDSTGVCTVCGAVNASKKEDSEKKSSTSETTSVSNKKTYTVTESAESASTVETNSSATNVEPSNAVSEKDDTVVNVESKEKETKVESLKAGKTNPLKTKSIKSANTKKFIVESNNISEQDNDSVMNSNEDVESAEIEENVDYSDNSEEYYEDTERVETAEETVSDEKIESKIEFKAIKQAVETISEVFEKIHSFFEGLFWGK